MKVLILCGGQGLRIKGFFGDLPKPLIPVHGKSLLSYIIESYAKHGLRHFILLVGENEQAFRDFAIQYSGEITVEVLQTGADTPTGGRLRKAAHLLSGESTFFLTYGDGIANIDFGVLKDFHRNHGKTATLTAVRPQLPFGLLNLEVDTSVTSFVEKPILEAYANGGFFVLQKDIFNLLAEDSDFEVDILPGLSQKKQLNAYIHTGFWKNMDTYKDYLYLETDDYLKDLNSENTAR